MLLDRWVPLDERSWIEVHSKSILQVRARQKTGLHWCTAASFLGSTGLAIPAAVLARKVLRNVTQNCTPVVLQTAKHLEVLQHGKVGWLRLRFTWLSIKLACQRLRRQEHVLHVQWTGCYKLLAHSCGKTTRPWPSSLKSSACRMGSQTAASMSACTS